MSLYNMINGVNIATFFILPLLGKHPNEYPRFRDCFFGKAVNDKKKKDQFGIPVKTLTKLDENLISVYTRVGGGNRKSYTKQIKELKKMPEYVEDYDDNFDSTFATFVYKVPKKWEKDYIHLMNGDPISKLSKEYRKQLYKIYPKLKKKLIKDLENPKTQDKAVDFTK